MQRAFKRADIPLWYTQGFNPHAYLMFPLALPLGTDSKIEILDVALVEKLGFDEIKSRLNASMPEGLRVNKVSAPVMKHTEIAAAAYTVRFSCNYDADRRRADLLSFRLRIKIENRKAFKKAMELILLI